MAGIGRLAGDAMARAKEAKANTLDIASLTREQWQYFQDFYKPIEDQALATAMQTNFDEERNEAGGLAANAYQAASQGMLSRNLRRSGATLSAEEEAGLGRRQALGKTKAVAGAENIAGRTLYETRLNMLSELVGIGRGAANTAMAGMQGAADLKAQREMWGRQARADARSTNLGMAASAAAYAISFL